MNIAMEKKEDSFCPIAEWLFMENWVSKDGMKIKEKTNLYQNKEKNLINTNNKMTERLLFLL
jgi:hypothetical protein